MALQLVSNLLLVTIFFPSFTFGSASWGYGTDNGPSTWGGSCNTGQSQSPVNIEDSEVEVVKIAALEFGNYDQAGPVEVENTGHGVEVRGFASWNASVRPFIQGGGLGAKYVLNQFHFHFAQTGNGSEHLVNGQYHEVEIHLVHTKEGLTQDEALNQTNGLAVVGVFYQLGSNGTSMDGLISAIGSVSEVSEVETTALEAYSPIVQLPGGTLINSFYRYNGSLTTPECQEAVVWIVLTEALSITQEQLDTLRTIKDSAGEPLATNVRPVQPLNGRKVQKNG